MSKYLIAIIIILSIICWCVFHEIGVVKKERDNYKTNQEILLTDVEFYRINDSLNVASAGVLKLRVDELKKFRADDVELIKKLKGNAKDLAQLTSVQATMIANFKGSVRDSIVYVDSTTTQVIKCIDVRNAWYSINGCIRGDSIEGTMKNRESLKIVERVRYKRFLGILWKTNKIKNRRVDVVSLNPHTQIDGVESVIIEE